MFKHAVVRKISKNYTKCISSHPQHSQLNIDKANIQHEAYVNALKNLGLDVIVLPSLDRFPDCCFVEDTAVIHQKKAVITNLGAHSRKGEADSIASTLKDYFTIKKIEPNGTIEGGDVIHFSTKLISGLSSRTNQQGVDQASSFLSVPIKTITDPSIVHLKSYISALSDDTILVSSKYASHPVLKEFKKLKVPVGEEYASNVLAVNGTIIIPNGFPKTEKLLEENGFDLIKLETSEIQKCEGALTCLSLLF